ncbi:hypothetical protein SEA_SONALI_61 [Arthrobacter phage Sonali]|uniref:Uncharacterized protein n=1 Tax=Arthrobacter phage Sonali TaxID=2510495 RepID=A0A411CR05_9CAUD|nr:hypothetical protein HOV09_gp61 [Arthrobacter phage Sonali]QAY16173.1 hypothetical protein SEA_SONALI_61 [Arthrobacter phage Sonali]
MSLQATITITLELTPEQDLSRVQAKVGDITEAVEELILDRFTPDNSPHQSEEPPYRFDRTPGPYVKSLKIGELANV